MFPTPITCWKTKPHIPYSLQSRSYRQCSSCLGPQARRQSHNASLPSYLVNFPSKTFTHTQKLNRTNQESCSPTDFPQRKADDAKLNRPPPTKKKKKRFRSDNLTTLTQLKNRKKTKAVSFKGSPIYGGQVRTTFAVHNMSEHAQGCESHRLITRLFPELLKQSVSAGATKNNGK